MDVPIVVMPLKVDVPVTAKRSDDELNVKSELPPKVVPSFVWICVTLPPGLFVPPAQPTQVVTVRVIIVELGVRNSDDEATPRFDTVK